MFSFWNLKSPTEISRMSKFLHTTGLNTQHFVGTIKRKSNLLEDKKGIESVLYNIVTPETESFTKPEGLFFFFLTAKKKLAM